jgi:hypothetical protein
MSLGLVDAQEAIRRELDKLCSELPRSVAGDCRDFVDKYEEQLVDMLLADFTPKEICTYLKLCDPDVKTIVTTPVRDICKLLPPFNIIFLHYIFEDQPYLFYMVRSFIS